NAGSVFEQRSALARLRARLRKRRVFARAERSGMTNSDFAIGSSHPRRLQLANPSHPEGFFYA
ncbi:hypothetical protein, partial [Pantoea septica]|uniref:hypothetical protein n=1 Tax=Pantoea septica TaxID=472695 RepID=UPI0028ACAA37